MRGSLALFPISADSLSSAPSDGPLPPPPSGLGFPLAHGFLSLLAVCVSGGLLPTPWG